MIKIKTQPIYEDAFNIFKKDKLSEVDRIEKLYGDFLKKLVDYWNENSAVKNADEYARSAAGNICDSNENDGVAKVLAEYLV